MLTLLALVALVSSVWLNHATIAVARKRGVGIDEGIGVQKVHSHWVPRLGGVPIFVSLVSSMLVLAWLTQSQVNTTLALIVCVLPAFGVGLVEDITQRAGVSIRLVLTMVSAALAWWLLDAKLIRLDIPYVDTLLATYSATAFILTLIAAAGIAHAVNIIDGYNGLSGFFVTVVLLSIGAVAWQVSDAFVCSVAFLAAASTAGFLLWNFPGGRIFLGDSGAYLLGFLIALLSILLVARNPQVSPWFPLLLVMHPVWETLFSMYRRSRRGLAEMGRPDALHLHSLFFRRVVTKYGASRRHKHRVRRNATTSVYFWGAALLCALPALVFWDRTLVLALFCAAFATMYVATYRRLVHFRTPRLLTRASAKQMRKVLPEL